MKNLYFILTACFLSIQLSYAQNNALPEIISDETTICYGGSVSLSLATNDWDSYSWSTGSSDASIIVTPMMNTVYSVTVTMDGLSYTDSIEITVAQANAGFIFGSSQVCKVNTGTTLSVFETNGSVTWQKSTNVFSNSPIWETIEGEDSTILATGEISQLTAFRTLVTINQCADTSDFFLINMTAFAGTVSTNSSKLCSGNTGTVLFMSGSLGTIQWQKSTNSGSSWTNLSGANTTLFSTGALTSAASFRAALSGGTCPMDYSNVIDITVSPAAVAGTAALNDATSGLTVCSGGSKAFKVTNNIGNIQWQSSSTSSTSGFNDIPDAVASIDTVENITSTKWYRAKISRNECIAYTNSIQITVNQPTLSGYISGNDSICSGQSSSLALNSSSGIVAWQRSTNWTADSPTWTTVLTGPITFSTGSINTSVAYRARLTSGVCPVSTSEVFVVYVSPTAASGTINSAASVCTGGDYTMTLSGFTGSKIQWQSGTTASGVFTDISNANSTSYTAINVTNSSSLFYRAVITSGVCALKATTTVKNIVVNSPSVAGLISGGGQICSNAGGTLSIANNNGNVQWQYSTDSSNFYNVPTVSADTVSIFNTSSVNGTSSTFVVSAVSSDIYMKGIVKNGACPSAETNVRKFEIKESAIGGNITGTKDICVTGNTGTSLTLNNYQGAITWQKSTNWASASPTWSNVVGSSSVLATGVLSISTAFRASVSIGTCSTVISDTLILSVYPASVAGTLSVNDANGLLVCKGGTKALKIAGNTGNITWQYSTNSSLNGYQNVEGVNTSNYTFSNIQVPTWFKAIVKSGVCPEVQANIVAIAVNQPTISGVITGEDSLCNNGSTVLTLNNYSGSITWQKSTNWNATTPTWTNAATTSSLTTGALTATTAFRAILSNNPCPSSTTNNFILTVSPLAVSGTINSVNSICTGSDITFSLSGFTGSSIQWQSSLTPTGVFSNISNATNPTLTLNQLSTSSNTSYRAIVTSGVCTLKATSTAKTITIFPVSLSGTISGGGLICPNTGGQLTIAGNRGTIQWQSSTDQGQTWNNISGASAANFSATNLAVTTDYRASVKNGDCPVVISNIKTFTVQSLANAGVISGNNQLCKVGLNATSLKVTGTLGTIKWQKSTNWTSTPPSWSDITGGTSTTLATGALTASTAFRVLANIGSCSNVASQVYVVTVFPTAVSGTVSLVDATSGLTVCSGGSKALKVSNNIGTIQWQTSSNDGLTWSSYDLPTTNQTFNFTNLTSTKSYRVGVKNGVCPTTVYSNAIKLTVSPTPVAGTVSADTNTLCSGASTNVKISNYTGSITWQKSTNWNTATPTWSVVSSNVSSVSTGNLNVTTAFRALITSSPCNSVTSNIIVINVIPIAVSGSISSSTPTVCAGGAVTLSLNGYVGSGIQWQSSTTPSGTFTNITGATNATLSLSNLTSSSILNYRAFVKSGTCTSATSSVKSITIDVPTVAGSVSGGGLICSGAGGSLSLSGQTGSIQWQYSTDGNSFANVPTSITSVPFSSSSTNATSSSYIVSNVTVSTYFRAMIKNGMCLSVPTNSKQFTVTSAAIAGTISGDDEICVTGNTGVSLSLAGSLGSITWQKSTNWNSASPTWSNMVGSSNSLATGALATTTAFRTSVSIGTCSTVLSEPFVVTVSPASVAGTVSVNDNSVANVCLGGSKALKVTGNVGTIQWQSSPNGLTNWVNVVGATTSPYTFSDLDSTISYRAVAKSGSCVSINGLKFTITVSNPVVLKTISGDGTVCTGTNSSTLTLASGSVGSIQWQKSTDNLTWTNVGSLVLPTSTSNAANSIIVTNLTSNTSYRVVLSNGQCASDTTTSVEIDMEQPSVSGTISGTNALCVPNNGTILTLTGSTGTITWQKANITNGVVGTFVTVPNQTSSSLTTGSLTVNTAFRAQVTNGVCPAKVTANYSVSMNTSSVAGLISGALTTVCNGTGTTLSLSGSTGTIAWQKSTNWTATSPTWSSVTGTTSSLTTGNLSSSTAYRAILSTTLCPNDTSSNYIVTVSDVAVGSSLSQNQTDPSGATAEMAICSNSNSKILSVNSGYTGNIQWQKSTNNSTWSDIAGANGTSYTVTSPSIGINYFRAKFSVCAKTAYSTNSIILYYALCESAKSMNNKDEEVNSFDALAYPNPFEDVVSLQVSTKGDEMVSITIFDVSGKILESVSLMPDELNSLSLGKNLNSGIYHVQINQGTESKIMRIVKR